MELFLTAVGIAVVTFVWTMLCEIAEALKGGDR